MNLHPTSQIALRDVAMRSVNKSEIVLISITGLIESWAYQ